ncbi:MAG TPA: T9SS type A sorting domain-containing protein [Bacteroidales bacterium]|nr:T9SS type A sorting domain-containing protein [Bacteroidales bacterium]HRZ48198.1 T9SS type A sorting domain-containing protein [Bacteroidales bacterium]
MMTKHFRCILVLLFILVLFRPVGLNAQYFINFAVTQPAVLQADAGPDHGINPGTQVTLGGPQSANGGTSPYTYLWVPASGLNDPLAANPVFVADSSRIFSLTVTDQNLCTAVDTAYVTVGTGCQEDGSNAVPWVISPNPVSHGRLVIRWPGLAGNTGIHLYSTDGRLMLQAALNASETTIDLNGHGITPGLYMLVADTSPVYRTKLLVL